MRTTHKPTEPVNMDDLLVELERFNAPEWMIERARELMSEQEMSPK
jgi:hypothetical protein